MQPQLCSRCKKNIAVVFITRQENGQNVNEGLCLKCAKNLGLPQVDEMMRRMGITDEDLDNISNEMMGAFGGVENLEGLTDADDPDAVWNIPFYPAGSCDAKAAGPDDVKHLKMWGRYGRADGVEFNARDFMDQHPLWKWMDGYLEDRPTQPWTLFD